MGSHIVRIYSGNMSGEGEPSPWQLVAKSPAAEAVSVFDSWFWRTRAMEVREVIDEITHTKEDDDAATDKFQEILAREFLTD